MPRRSIKIISGMLAAGAVGAFAFTQLASAGVSALAGHTPMLPTVRAAAHPNVFAAHPTPKPETSTVTLPTPCAVINTTHTGALHAGKPKTYSVSKCGVPASATAVQLAVTVAHSTASGFVAFYQHGTTRTAAHALDFTKGATVSTTTTVGVAAGQFDGVFGASSGLTGATALVMGYSLPSIDGLLYTGSTTYLYSGSPRILSTTFVSTGTITVTVDRDISYCTLLASPYYANNYASAQPVDGGQLRVKTWKIDATTHTEVPLDTFVALHVVC